MQQESLSDESSDSENSDSDDEEGKFDEFFLYFIKEISKELQVFWNVSLQCFGS